MVGTLTATAVPLIIEPVAIGFTGGGALDAQSIVPIIAMSATYTGAGSLTAPSFPQFASTATLTGNGDLVCSIKQIYQAIANLFGGGTITGGGTASYSRTAALSGSGTLSATMAGIVPVTIVGTPNAVAASSVAIPAHQVGDLIIIYACNSGGTAAPGKPAAGGTVPAWTYIQTGVGSGNLAGGAAYAIATATNHTSGTWANTIIMMAIVLRGQHATTPIGGSSKKYTNENGTISTTAITPIHSDGTSVLLYIHLHGSSVTMNAAPTGYTRVGALSSYLAMNKKTSTTTDGAVQQTCSGAADWSNGMIIEVRN